VSYGTVNIIAGTHSGVMRVKEIKKKRIKFHIPQSEVLQDYGRYLHPYPCHIIFLFFPLLSKGDLKKEKKENYRGDSVLK